MRLVEISFCFLMRIHSMFVAFSISSFKHTIVGINYVTSLIHCIIQLYHFGYKPKFSFSFSLLFLKYSSGLQSCLLFHADARAKCPPQRPQLRNLHVRQQKLAGNRVYFWAQLEFHEILAIWNWHHWLTTRSTICPSTFEPSPISCEDESI